MKTLLLLCSLLFSAYSFAEVAPTRQIEITEDKGLERHWYNFGTVRVNTSNYAGYRLTNTGSVPMNLQSAQIRGMNFSARHSCWGVLLPGQRCAFTIQYSPMFPGYDNGQFLMTFDGDYQLLIDLSGNAVR